MQYLQPYLYQVIREAIECRRMSKKFPYLAIHNEIMSRINADMKATIDEMEADGILGHSENINGIYMYRVEKELGVGLPPEHEP